MYSNSILNFQESTTILNACTKIVWKLIEGPTYLNYIYAIPLTYIPCPLIQDLLMWPSKNNKI